MGRRSPYGKHKRKSTMEDTCKTGALADVDGEEGEGKWNNMSKEEDAWKLGKITSLALDVHGTA